jgi:hypothetical protein
MEGYVLVTEIEIEIGRVRAISSCCMIFVGAGHGCNLDRGHNFYSYYDSDFRFAVHLVKLVRRISAGA